MDPLTAINQAARRFTLKFPKPPRANSVDASEAGALAPGTHVVVPSRDLQGDEEASWHHGVFVGKHFQNRDLPAGRVLHVSKASGLELVPVTAFMSPDANVYFVEYPEEGCFPVQTTLDLADIFLQHKDLFANNCEMIACLCKVGGYCQPVFDACGMIPRPVRTHRPPKLLL